MDLFCFPVDPHLSDTHYKNYSVRYISSETRNTFDQDPATQYTVASQVGKEQVLTSIGFFVFVHLFASVVSGSTQSNMLTL